MYWFDNIGDSIGWKTESRDAVYENLFENVTNSRFEYGPSTWIAIDVLC